MQTPTQTLYRYIQTMKQEGEFNNGTVIAISDDQQEAILEHCLDSGMMAGTEQTGIQYERLADKNDFSCGDEFTFYTIADADKFQALVEGMDLATGAVEQEISDDFTDALRTVFIIDGYGPESGRGSSYRTFARKARYAVETQARTDVLRNRLADAGYTVEEYNAAQRTSFFADPRPAVLDAVSEWGFPCGLVESLNA